MKKHKLKLPGLAYLLPGAALPMLAALILGSASSVGAKDPKPKEPKKPLTGAQLYQMHCNRCHAERYATEWTAAQWKTLIMHMRVRANLPAAQAKQILKYLQEDSGN